MEKKMKEKLMHLVVLYNELDELKSRVRRHDTGHIKTAISVLQSRVSEIKQDLLNIKETDDG